MSLQLLTIQNWLSFHARYRPNHTALVFQDQRSTYRELNDRVNRLSNAFLAAGIQKGDRVATILYNSPELYETYWACAAIGAVAVPLSPLLRGQGLLNLLNNSGTSLAITCQLLMPFLKEIKNELKIPENNIWLVDGADEKTSYHKNLQSASAILVNQQEISGDDPYNIIYSSGTTGLPKGIVISHAVRALYGSLFANAYRMTPESVVLHSGAIIFNGSFLTLMPAMYMGCTYILQSHFDADEVIEKIHSEEVTHTILVPSQIINCLQSERFNAGYLSSLEYVLSVGAPLLQEHKEALNERLPGVFYELYGLTEGFMTILDRNDASRKSGSVGRPPQFMDMKIVDEESRELPPGKIGEIVGRGPLLMTDYYNAPEQTAGAIRDGWLYTGDLGYVDEEGFLFLTGRKKDLIISGGVNVYPTDIEEVIARHPLVKDVAVFGVPHDEWGETPVAAIVLKPGKEVSAESLRTWINQNIEARFQKVFEVILMEELPRNVAGKILKRELKENYQKQHV